MTNVRVIYILLLAGALVMAAIYGVYQAALIFMIFIILPVFFSLYCLYIISGLELRAEDIQLVSEKGQSVPIMLEIANKRILPAARIDIVVNTRNSFAEAGNKSSIVTALKGGSKKNLEYILKSDYCGKILVIVEEIRVYDPLLLIRIRRRPGLKLFTSVLPEIHKLNTEIDYRSTEQLEGESFSPYKSGDDPSEIFDVREYADGDKYRRIHWKLSFKQKKLMVKDYSSPVDDSVTLLVDLCVGEHISYLEAIDALLDEAASLSEYFTENGVLHRLCWYDAGRDELVSARIERASDMYEALGGILGTGVYHGKPRGIFSLDLAHRKCTHLFLFIPEPPCDDGDELVLISDRLSIIYIEDEGSRGTEKAYFGELCPIILPSKREIIHEA